MEEFFKSVEEYAARKEWAAPELHGEGKDAYLSVNIPDRFLCRGDLDALSKFVESHKGTFSVVASDGCISVLFSFVGY